MAVRLGVNGFGRIGRLVVRALREMEAPVDLVAINDPADGATLAHLFRYDSVHGRYRGQVDAEGETLRFDGDEATLLHEAQPEDIPWRDLDVDVVLEASGRFTQRSGLLGHLAGGAPRVLLTAPGDVDVQVVRGVNDGALGSHSLVGAASCTTNCLAPIVQVLDHAFEVRRGYMTTVHAATNDQAVADRVHSDLRRARATLAAMIPTKTGAARAIGDVLPHLKGKLDGLAVRVPTLDVSLLDLVVQLRGRPDRDAVISALEEAARGRLQGILGCESAPLVSADFIHDARSAVVDIQLVEAADGMAKVLAWYDNEWGYANRVAELAVRMGP